jgi:hypothetical protein
MVDRLEAAASVRPVGFAPLRGLVDGRDDSTIVFATALRTGHETLRAGGPRSRAAAAPRRDAVRTMEV